LGLKESSFGTWNRDEVSYLSREGKQYAEGKFLEEGRVQGKKKKGAERKRR